MDLLLDVLFFRSKVTYLLLAAAIIVGLVLYLT